MTIFLSAVCWLNDIMISVCALMCPICFLEICSRVLPDFHSNSLSSVYSNL